MKIHTNLFALDSFQCVFILISPSEVEANPALWLTAVSQYKVSLIPTILHRCIMKTKRCELRPSLYLKVRDTFCSYGVMELCTRGLVSFLLETLKKNAFVELLPLIRLFNRVVLSNN